MVAGICTLRAYLSLSQDDLASEGLLLIRVKPDEGGRYGFNIKVRRRRSLIDRHTALTGIGGVLQNMMIIVHMGRLLNIRSRDLLC